MGGNCNDLVHTSLKGAKYKVIMGHIFLGLCQKLKKKCPIEGNFPENNFMHFVGQSYCVPNI